MVTDEIGHTAGKIWKTLNSEGEMSVAALKKAVSPKDSLADWAIGWLAREGKIAFRKEKNVLRVRLKH